MDVTDIFYKITKGCRFSSSKHGKPLHANKKSLIPRNNYLTQSIAPETAAKENEEKHSAESLRKQNMIKVVGEDIPDVVDTFEQMRKVLGLSDTLVSNISTSGYYSPTPVQQQVIPIMIKSRDVLVCAPTGSGKTAAYLIPLIQQVVSSSEKRGFHSLIVAPSRELGRQIFLEAQRLSQNTSVDVYCLDKAIKQNNQIEKKCVSRKHRIIITTPNRLIYLLDEKLLNLSGLEWLVVDESDKLFEEGVRGFRDQLGKIYSACNLLSHVKLALFSATYAQDVQQWCDMNLDNLISVFVGGKNSACDVLEQELVFTGSEDGKILAFRNIVRAGLTTPCLIFVQTKDRAKELYREILYDGIMVDVIHSDLSKAERDNVVKSFRSGSVWVLICTGLMGRGIDFKGVNLVINFDMPASAVDYIHRIGRTGRAGIPGKAVSFFTQDDVANMRQIAYLAKRSGADVPSYLLDAPKKRCKERKHLAQHPISRNSIDTASLYDRAQHARIKSLRKSQLKRAGHGMAKGVNSDEPAVDMKGKGIRKRERFIQNFKAEARNRKKHAKAKAGINKPNLSNQCPNICV